MRNPIRIPLLFVAASLFGCAASSTAGRAPASATLYQRLGGKPAIAVVVDKFVANVAADKRINRYFWNADVVNLKVMLNEQLCAATGGPCIYTGKDMRAAHAGMNISDGDFMALVEDLTGALTEARVQAREQKDLMAALGGLKGQIVHQ